MASPYNPYSSSPARAEVGNSGDPIEWAGAAAENAKYYAKKFADWATDAPPEGVTNAEQWISRATSEEERAHRIAHAPRVFGAESVSPEVLAGAQSYPLPGETPTGEGTAAAMSTMPEYQTQEILGTPEPPPTQPPADTLPATTPPATRGYPGMGSIKGKLRALEGEIDRETVFQKKRYKEEEKAYEDHLKKVSDASQVEAARGKMRTAEGALNTATDKLKNWEIDPNRAFPNAFSKVAAVIGVAMGAYAQGLSGGKLPNTALQIVNSAIDRDIDAQKAEYAKLKGLVDEKRNVYGMAMRMLGDERQADELARSAAYRSFKGQMDSMGRQFGLTNQQMAQKFSVLGLEQKENEARARLMQLAAKGSGKVGAKSKEEFATLQSIRGQLGKLKGLFKNKGPEDIPGSWKVTQAFFDTHGGKIEDARGLIARQLLMYTDKSRISDADYEIMMGFVPGVWKSKARANSMIGGLAEMLNTIESARYDQMDKAARSEHLRKKAVQLAQDNKLDGDIFSSSEDKTASYWRSQRAQTEVKE